MRFRSAVLAAVLLAATAPAARAALGLTAPVPAPAAEGLNLTAGAASVDSSWHVGASAGQYASDGTFAGAHGIDPHQHSTRRQSSTGVQSTTKVRALVLDDGAGDRHAIVTNDLYIPQDLVNRRVAQILADRDRDIDLGLVDGTKTGIGESQLTISVSHSHSSPYYSTPAWGVWAFQDVFDIRFFEYIAGRMAAAVVEASSDMRPARVGGATSAFARTQRHAFGPAVADDGTPAGYPHTDNDNTVSVVRVDDVSGPEPAPLAHWVVFGMHPEMLDGNDLMSAEWVGAMQRNVERQLGGVALFSQNNTGTAETGSDAKAQPPAERSEYSHKEYAQMERAAWKLTEAVVDTSADIEAATPEMPESWAAFTTTPDLEVSDLRFAPPSLRAAPTVSSCRAEKAFAGNPGIPLAGLPDCQFPVADAGLDESLPFDPAVTYRTLREAGVPVPDNVGAPSVTGLQETAQVHLQAIRIGDIGITVCPCEQWADQSRNIKSRINRVVGDLFVGFDWTAATVERNGSTRDFCVQGDDSRWTCADPRNPAADLPPVDDIAYRRMRAQIDNDAAGWEDPAYAPYAETEPVDPAEVKGNFTHEELTDFGYGMVVPVGMANDYLGYIATYREFQRGDHYRKALTGLGPHSADFLATRLTRMAASLNGWNGPLTTAKDTLYGAEDQRQRATAAAIGALAERYLPAYAATLPADGGQPAVTTEPASIERFSAARVAWVGGSTWFDIPAVVVERFDDEAGRFVAYGDTTGEIQMRPTFPGPADMASWRAGTFAWTWEATFEAYDSDIALPDASGVMRTQTPAGRYRFVVEGRRHAGAGEVEPYSLTSAEFEVTPWRGITATGIGVDGDGHPSVAVGPARVVSYGSAGSRTVGPVDYPDTYASPFAFVDGTREIRTYGPGPADDQQFCFHCSFRPWADTGTVESVTFEVTRAGTTFSMAAIPGPGGRWRGETPLLPGDSVRVAPGGVVDGFGETNGAPSSTVIA